MFRKLFFIALVLSYTATVGLAQQTTIFSEANLAYKRGIEFYEKGVFGLAQKEFKEALELLKPVNQAEAELLRTKARLHYAKSAVRLEHPDGEKLILDFARAYAPDPLANQAVIEIANYYYNSQEYIKAASLFSKVDTYNLSKDERSEIKFKEGYSYFVKKKFKQANTCFKQIKEIKNIYYYPSNYYYGMTAFFDDNYDEAVSSFQRVANSKKYKPYIPYYVCQIYFAQNKLDKLISYAEPKLSISGLKNKNEIHQLLGQAYFERGAYQKALPLLEQYAERSSKMREEDFYQLGYVQYKSGLYKKAASNLTELSLIDSKLGQNAMYILADCMIKNNDKASARNAFKSASKMNYDETVKAEALYNYGKLSYELNYDREAINALQMVRATSPYHQEAQTMLSALFLNTRDYDNTMKIIEAMPSKTPQIRETYQKVAYYKGVQLYNDGDTEGAEIFFNKSLDVPIDVRTKALALYWLGEMEYKEEEYTSSIRKMDQFLLASKGLYQLPDHASPFTANYTQGYNYLKQKKYNEALSYFTNAIDGMRTNSNSITDAYIKKKVYPDALLRAGDCYFKQNNYAPAIQLYDEVINNRYDGFVYALYQKAIMEGLSGNTTNKIIALEDIVNKYKDTEYTDDALFQLGSTYLEINKLNDAKLPFRTLTKDFKNSPLLNPSLLKLGLLSYNQGNPTEAIKYYKEVFKNNPEDVDAQVALAALEEIYVEDLGKPDEYLAFVESLSGYEVDNTEKDDISFKAAETQFENSNYERAIKGYNNYLNKYPNGRNALLAYYHRGESFAVLKNYSKALQDYETVIGKGNSAYLAKALRKAALITYNDNQDFEKAYQYYTELEKVATTEDQQFEAQLGALRAGYRIGKADAVYVMAEKVRTNTKATQDQVTQANFYLGKMAFDKKDYNRALEAFNQVVKNSDNEQTAEARYSIAYIYYVQRELEIAQQLCINSNKESSNYPYWIAKSVILLADIFAEKGDLFNARAALEALIENYDEDQELVSIAKAKLEKLNEQESAASRISEEPEDDETLEMDEEGQ